MGLLHLAERVGKTALNLSGFKSRWVSTSVAKIHIYDAPGTGMLPPVVVLHGISSSAIPFSQTLQRLRKRFQRVLAPEAPGHGSSGDPPSPFTPDALFSAMTEMLDQVVEQPSIVFGNSLGGAVALRYAMDRPKKVRALVLASPAGANVDESEFQELLSSFEMHSTQDARVFMERLYHRMPWFAPLFASDVVQQFSRDVVTSLLQTAEPKHAFTSDELRNLEMPILLIWGQSERLMPKACLDYFKAHLPAHARVEQPYGLGHCPHVDNPRLLARTIASFVEDIMKSKL